LAADIHDRVPELLRELLALNVQVIVAQGAVVPVVRQAIDATPVVFGYRGDPVEAGLVNSFGRPGGHLTGATYVSHEVNAKRLELLRGAFPHVGRVAIWLMRADRNAANRCKRCGPIRWAVQ
jgi:putative ABC transport system substrate-binding protein